MTTPIPLARGWLPAAPSTLDPLRKYWLFRPGALTAGLRQLGHVRLRVLAEYPTGAPRDEATACASPRKARSGCAKC
ncbi:chorismate--pyruvate lyase [Bordetella pertussis]|nr:chorismate--pyruvate lyase [Bordetella pertussis]